MTDLFTWIHSLLGSAPAGLHWLEYVLVALLVLVFIDVILTFIISCITYLIGGFKK